MPTKPIRVLLVDDHTVVRNGVRLMLSSAADIEVTGEAAQASEALRLIHEQDFDAALVDIALPGKNGLELLKLLRAQKPKLAVLLLSTYAEEVYAVRSLKLGAAGYLTKDVPAATLIEAVRKVARGGKYVSIALLETLANAVSNDPRASGHETLSNRELEILKLLARGNSLIVIANALHLSPKTVTTYRARILDKLQLHSNAELARYAIENGLLR